MCGPVTSLLGVAEHGLMTDVDPQFQEDLHALRRALDAQGLTGQDYPDGIVNVPGIGPKRFGDCSGADLAIITEVHEQHEQS